MLCSKSATRVRATSVSLRILDRRSVGFGTDSTRAAARNPSTSWVTAPRVRPSDEATSPGVTPSVARASRNSTDIWLDVSSTPSNGVRRSDAMLRLSATTSPCSGATQARVANLLRSPATPGVRRLRTRTVASNGPVIVPLSKNGDTYSVPPGRKLTASQLQAFKAGNTYVNVHTAKNKGGEVRAQLQP